MNLTREEVVKLMLKDTDPKEVTHYISEDSGVEVYITGKLNVKKFAKLLYENYFNKY